MSVVFLGRSLRLPSADRAGLAVVGFFVACAVALIACAVASRVLHEGPFDGIPAVLS